MKKSYILSLMTICLILLGCSNFTESQASTIPWDGIYIRGGNKFTRSILEITSVTRDNFHFKINALDGGNMGNISGEAKISQNTATFEDGKGFFLIFTYGEEKVTIEENHEKNTYCGMGVEFEGVYDRKGTEKFNDYGQSYFTHCKVFKDEQEKEFVRLVGDYYKKFTDTAHMLYQEEDLDHLGARVHRMGVRGLFTFLESIIMIRDSDNAIWAAVIDGDKVLYFTNTSDFEYVPITINKWHDRFKDKPIYYISAQ